MTLVPAWILSDPAVSTANCSTKFHRGISNARWRQKPFAGNAEASFPAASHLTWPVRPSGPKITPPLPLFVHARGLTPCRPVHRGHVQLD